MWQATSCSHKKSLHWLVIERSQNIVGDKTGKNCYVYRSYLSTSVMHSRWLVQYPDVYWYTKLPSFPCHFHQRVCKRQIMRFCLQSSEQVIACLCCRHSQGSVRLHPTCKSACELLMLSHALATDLFMSLSISLSFPGNKSQREELDSILFIFEVSSTQRHALINDKSSIPYMMSIRLGLLDHIKHVTQQWMFELRCLYYSVEKCWSVNQWRLLQFGHPSSQSILMKHDRSRLIYSHSCSKGLVLISWLD